MKKYLETERIYLREFTADDVDLVYDLNSDPDVMKYLSGVKPSTREEVIETIKKILAPSLKFIGLSSAEEYQNTWPGENMVRYSPIRKQYNKIKL